MKNLSIPLVALLMATAVQAQVSVKDAWVRSSVPGQQATGAFMKITSTENARLVAVSSPVAGVVEVHEMKMEGDVMRMRAVPVLELPAGKTVELKSGGYHVMLLDLKTTLKRGGVVPMTLTFKDAKGVETKVELQVPVTTTGPGASMQGQGMMKH